MKRKKGIYGSFLSGFSLGVHRVGHVLNGRGRRGLESTEEVTSNEKYESSSDEDGSFRRTSFTVDGFRTGGSMLVRGFSV